MSARNTLLAVLLAFSLYVPMMAQDADVIKVSVDLVTVNVAVTDSKGRPVADLLAQDFLVKDQHKPVELKFFDAQGPASIVFVVDISTSMGGDRWRALRAGLKKFLTSARENNDYTLITFSNMPQLVARSVNAEALWQHFNSLKPSGHTALYDGVLLGLKALDQLPQRQKAVVLLSDGQDNSSAATLQEVQREIFNERATIYTIGMVFNHYEYSGIDRAGRELLQVLADVSGGLAYLPQPSQLRETLEKISADVRSQYSLSYYPPDKAPGCRHILVSTQGERQLKLRYQERYVMQSDTDRHSSFQPVGNTANECWNKPSNLSLGKSRKR